MDDKNDQKLSEIILELTTKLCNVEEIERIKKELDRIHVSKTAHTFGLFCKSSNIDGLKCPLLEDKENYCEFYKQKLSFYNNNLESNPQIRIWECLLNDPPNVWSKLK